MAEEAGQKEKWSEEACSDFAKRVRRFGIQVEELTLKPAPGPPKRTVDEQRDEEGKDILSRVGAGEGPLVVLDERGDQLDSLEFAKFLQVLPPVRRARADANLTVAYATGLRRQRGPCGDVRDRRSHHPRRHRQSLRLQRAQWLRDRRQYVLPPLAHLRHLVVVLPLA